MRKQMLNRDVFAHPFCELRDVLHHPVRQMQLATVRKHHHARGRHRLGDGGEQENGIGIRHLAKSLFKCRRPASHMQHGGLENACVHLLLNDARGRFHRTSTGTRQSKGGSESGHHKSDIVSSLHKKSPQRLPWSPLKDIRQPTTGFRTEPTENLRDRK